jgi:hypothetical protein
MRSAESKTFHGKGTQIALYWGSFKEKHTFISDLVFWIYQGHPIKQY